jgi:hypothetical protein
MCFWVGDAARRSGRLGPEADVLCTRDPRYRVARSMLAFSSADRSYFRSEDHVAFSVSGTEAVVWDWLFRVVGVVRCGCYGVAVNLRFVEGT